MMLCDAFNWISKFVKFAPIFLLFLLQNLSIKKLAAKMPFILCYTVVLFKISILN
jgi:hypothetical protein